ncbi:hypothetical protein D4764_16G0002290 [Takifugu flavidus]|uniref:Uncharacterized protein n=1 Tax=Takifugu flavidus TaxID=433684 RepID=A0A5C6NW89_9TELE|nr:hypothetical protein D4764_16G0002290 [Takifugu flavidus]
MEEGSVQNHHKHGHHRLFTSFLPLKHAHVAEFYWNLDQNQPIRDCVTVDDVIERAITSGRARARRAQPGRVQHSGRPNVLKALFVREQRGSSQLSISLSQQAERRPYCSAHVGTELRLSGGAGVWFCRGRVTSEHDPGRRNRAAPPQGPCKSARSKSCQADAAFVRKSSGSLKRRKSGCSEVFLDRSLFRLSPAPSPASCRGDDGIQTAMLILWILYSQPL